MTSQHDHENDERFETGLRKAAGEIHPRAAFVQGLRRELNSRASLPQPWYVTARRYIPQAAALGVLFGLLALSLLLTPNLFQEPSSGTAPLQGTALPGQPPPEPTAEPMEATATPQPVPTQVNGPIVYTVAQGDTCTGIEDMFNTPASGIIALNGLNADCSDLVVGQVLVIPSPTLAFELNGRDVTKNEFRSPDGQWSAEVLLARPQDGAARPEDYHRLTVRGAAGEAWVYEQWTDTETTRTGWSELKWVDKAVYWYQNTSKLDICHADWSTHLRRMDLTTGAVTDVPGFGPDWQGSLSFSPDTGAFASLEGTELVIRSLEDERLAAEVQRIPFEPINPNSWGARALTYQPEDTGIVMIQHSPENLMCSGGPVIEGVVVFDLRSWTARQHPIPDGYQFRGYDIAGIVDLIGPDGLIYLMDMQTGALEPAVNDPDSAVITRYTVVEGDTCVGIAQTFNVQVSSLTALNGLNADCSNLVVGQELSIPEPEIVSDITPVPLGKLAIYYSEYTVAEGDTCAGIASTFNISVESLIEINQLNEDCGDLIVGQQLPIPYPTPVPIVPDWKIDLGVRAEDDENAAQTLFDFLTALAVQDYTRASVYYGGSLSFDGRDFDHAAALLQQACESGGYVCLHPRNITTKSYFGAMGGFDFAVVYTSPDSAEYSQDGRNTFIFSVRPGAPGPYRVVNLPLQPFMPVPTQSYPPVSSLTMEQLIESIYTSEGDYARFTEIMERLEALGPGAIDAASHIANAIKHPPHYAHLAAKTLIGFGPDITSSTLPVLIDHLDSGVTETRTYSAAVVGTVGETASCAVGDIGPLLWDADPVTRFTAAWALEQITGEKLLPENARVEGDPLTANRFVADTPEGSVVKAARDWWLAEGTGVDWHPSYGICDP